MKKVVVIGAGIGGISTAIRLAKKGYDVTVLEKSNYVGGKCRTVTYDGFTFDAGPSLLTIPAVFRDLFMKSGKRIELLLDLKPVDPAFEYRFADGESIKFKNLSIRENANEIERVLGKKEGDAWHNLMQRAERMWDISRIPFIESAFNIKSFIKSLSIEKILSIAPFTSLDKYVARFSKNPKIKNIVNRYATYSGSDPRKAPAALLTIPFIESSFGAWHISGGLGKLSQALHARALDLGIEIKLNIEVEEILIWQGSVTGVTTKSGETLSADIVVANADASLVYEKLIKSSNRKLNSERKKIKKAVQSFSGFSIFLALDNSKVSNPPKLNHHTVFFPHQYEEEFVDLFDRGEPVKDPAIYICAPDDTEMRPSGNFEAWSILVNAPIHNPESGIDWRRIESEYAQKIIRKLDQLGLQVSERLLFMKFKSPADLELETSAPGGSIYGTSSNGVRAAFMRARNRSKINGLFLVGGSAHPGGGLPLVGISSEIVSDLIN